MIKKCARCSFENKKVNSDYSHSIVCGNCGLKLSAYSNKTEFGIHPILAKRYEATSKPAFARVESKSENSEDAQANVPKIPGYEMLEIIGKGAMGSVYSAVHLKSGRKTAVKILLPELVSRTDLVARFEREIAALRSFRHKNVVTILESGQLEQTHFFSMEFVQGVNLRKVLKSKSLLLSAGIKICRQILEALRAAHARGIIHRDLKPENIIIECKDGDDITGDERVVLADFGLAGILNEEANPHPNLTHSKVTMGTVNYMAPEQHVDAKRVDLRTDIYSCGVILYECITGDLPLGRFALPSEKGVLAPRALDDCIAKALARSAGERYQNVDEFDANLEKIQKELAIGKFESPSAAAARTKKSERISSLETIFPTKWMKSPPWMKRPALVAAGVTFLLFAMAGVFLVARTPNEYIVSDLGISPVYGRTTFMAPLPSFKDSDGRLLASLERKGMQASWDSDSPVWSFQKNQYAYLAQKGENLHLRDGMSLGTSPHKIDLNNSMEFKSQLLLDSIGLKKSKERITAGIGSVLNEDSLAGAGGIFIVDKSKRRAIGVVVYEDGRCGMMTIQRDGVRFKETSELGELCNLRPDKNTIKLVCDSKESSCYGVFGTKKFHAETVPNLAGGNWYPALGCKNTNCLFDGGKS